MMGYRRPVPPAMVWKMVDFSGMSAMGNFRAIAVVVWVFMGVV